MRAFWERHPLAAFFAVVFFSWVGWFFYVFGAVGNGVRITRAYVAAARSDWKRDTKRLLTSWFEKAAKKRIQRKRTLEGRR